MVKYHNSMVVFEEIPDEVTLAINITNCPCKCPGCHSKFLWEDIGTELTIQEVERLVNENSGITCVCLMGGDREPGVIDSLAHHITIILGLKVAWYSGRDKISDAININNFNYIKIGHYDEKRGPLNKNTTNQVLYRVVDGKLEGITYKFWQKL